MLLYKSTVTDNNNNNNKDVVRQMDEYRKLWWQFYHQ